MSATTTRSAGQALSLTLSKDHARRLRKLARLLEIRPEKLHRWLLTRQLEIHEDPDFGCLEHIASVLPGSDERRQRAQANVQTWLGKRGAKAA